MLGINNAFWIVIGVGALVFLFLVLALRLSHKKRLNLESYIVYLLLEDAIRQDHKNKLITYIKELNESSADKIRPLASEAIDIMSEGLAEEGNSLLASNAMLIDIKKGK